MSRPVLPIHCGEGGFSVPCIDGLGLVQSQAGGRRAASGPVLDSDL